MRVWLRPLLYRGRWSTWNDQGILHALMVGVREMQQRAPRRHRHQRIKSAVHRPPNKEGVVITIDPDSRCGNRKLLTL